MKIIKTVCILCMVLCSFNAKSQWIDSLKLYPQNPTDSDTITIMCYVTYGQSGCDLSSKELVWFGNECWGKAFHCMSAFTILCPTIDTFIIAPLPLGSYTFNYWPGYDTVPPCGWPVDTGGNPVPYPYSTETIFFSVTPVGLTETDASNKEIVIYPNPTSGKFTVQGASGEIQLYDLFGRLLLRSNKAQIDMSNYPVGMYLWRVGTARGKVVVE